VTVAAPPSSAVAAGSAVTPQNSGGGEMLSMNESSETIPPPSQHGFVVLGTDPVHLYLYHLATRNNPRHKAELAEILKNGDGKLFTMLTENKFTLHDLHNQGNRFARGFIKATS
jgi:hypothetical protein